MPVKLSGKIRAKEPQHANVVQFQLSNLDVTQGFITLTGENLYLLFSDSEAAHVILSNRTRVGDAANKGAEISDRRL